MSVAGWINTLATFVQLAASATNPFIYGIFRSEFRKAFKAQYRKLVYRLGCEDSYWFKRSAANKSPAASPPLPRASANTLEELPPTTVLIYRAGDELDNPGQIAKAVCATSSPSILPDMKDERLM